MREILDKANDLGLLIRETDIYRRFRDITEELENEPGIKGKLDNYYRSAEDLKKREDLGDIIEKYEIEEFEEMSSAIAENELIVRYLSAKNEYIKLLTDIQKSVREDDFTGDE